MLGLCLPPGPLRLDGARGLDVCDLWTKAFNYVQHCRMLFLSSMETGHIQDAGCSFSLVLELGNVGQDTQLTHGGHVALVRYKVCCVLGAFESLLPAYVMSLAQINS